MLDPIDTIDMKSCRICLTNNKPLCPLFRYKLSGNYAEMLTAIADVKVSSNDGLPEKICLKCCTTLEKAYLLKTVAERSDKKLRKILAREKGNVPTKKIAFDSFTDIKSEIGPLTIKPEPKWEMEIEVPESSRPVDTMEVKDIVIANTVIRKVDPNAEEIKLDSNDDVQLTWTSSGNSHYAAKGDPDAEYLEDDVFQDDDDDDYIPPVEKPKTKFKKPKLSDIKVFKGKTVVRKVKVLKKIKDDPEYDSGRSRDENKSRSTTITCYPILKNGSRGSPILLKRPKDATILKVHPGYKSKSQSSSSESVKVVRRDKPVRMVRTSVSKQREKLVCPVCGILTFTLGNHMATHQEKKRYTCAQCPRSFAQKSNLLIHAKQHTGIKDHICEVCGAGFYSQKSLVRHNLIHKGERPFSCNLCTKRFIAMAGLRRHMAIHTGEKRYNCSFCNKKFTQSHHLQNHMITHTGDRPYTCEVCNVAFSYKVNLNNHVYKVHGINLKFKSIHTVTEDILRREMGMMNETRVAITHILPQLGEVPTPAAHETVLSLT
ncbi:zinc finger and BTB domain-containing protein 24 isoform X2 [Spodoptera frugiperda]|uniref:Zinc finger and BTB domain-containing protein 24 isoform X2 n=1 Tax=Spodoptera frugiperda TaxID=7108 RepID=A0A9R0DKA1_SPOFR|nr:zinc finger and BTB domain-containing protein 24 isoform X2 [Spodoptera frugiperda]